MKKILILLIVVALGAVGYFAFSRIFPKDEAILTPEPAGELPTVGLSEPSGRPSFAGDLAEPAEPQQFGQVVKKVSEEKILDYWVSEDAVLLFLEDGAIKTLEGEEVFKSEITRESFVSLEPSLTGRYALVRFLAQPEGESRFAIYDSASSSWSAAPPRILAASFSPEKENLLAYFDGSAIRLFDADTAKSDLLVPFNGEDISLSWPSSSRLYLSSPSFSQTFNFVLALDVEEKTLKSVVAETQGLSVFWPKNAGFGLKTELENPNLALISLDGEVLATLPMAGSPDACLADENFLACSAPVGAHGKNFLSDILVGSVFSNSRLTGFDISDIKNPLLQPIVLGSVEALITKLKKIGPSLFFINRYDSRLYKIDLP